MKIFISTSTFGREDKVPAQMLKKAGYKITFNPYGRTLTETECIKHFRNIDALLAGTEKITAAVLEVSSRLKVISRCGSGIDNIDLKKAEELGIKVYNTPEAPVDSVAELTLALILNLLRKINIHDRELKEGKWRKLSGNLLSGKVVGILGLGRIGKRVAELVSPFGVKILATDSKKDPAFAKKHKITYLSLNELLKRADILTINLSTNIPAPVAANFSLRRIKEIIINKKHLSLMKPSSVIINTSRGSFLDEKALYLSLKKNRISGAALDVFEKEPYTGRLRNLPNVLLTPHIGSYSRETRIKMEQQSSENLISGLARGGVLGHNYYGHK